MEEKRVENKSCPFSGNQFALIRNRLRSESGFVPHFQQGFDKILMVFLDAGSIVFLSGIWPLVDVGYEADKQEDFHLAFTENSKFILTSPLKC